MYKIFLTVRDRLNLTKMCIEAIEKHSKRNYQLYIYDNLTSYKTQEHFLYYSMLYEQKRITQVCFTTKESTFDSFSKSSTCNFFGQQHEQDPNKDNYEFLVLLDNDVIVSPGWDETLFNAWKTVIKSNKNKIKVITYLNKSIKKQKEFPDIDGRKCAVGRFSGSALWCVKTDFFSDVGFLDLSSMIGMNKKHDQRYWPRLKEKSGTDEYILGVEGIAYHYYKVGSMCNLLTKYKIDDPDYNNKLMEIQTTDDTLADTKFNNFYNKNNNKKNSPTVKENVVLAGICWGEFFWELFRFAPYIIWKKRVEYKNKNVKFIVITRPNRYDLYGLHSDIFIPLVLDGDETKYKQNSFRLDGISENDCGDIMNSYIENLSTRYNIIEHIKPDISKKQFSTKNQFPPDKRLFWFRPRKANGIVVDKYLSRYNNKKNIIISPRNREGTPRNWEKWQELYNLIQQDKKLMSKFNFIICGAPGTYVEDKNNIFLDMKNVENNINTSASGILFEFLNRSVFTIGSQSAIPNISLLFGIEVLEWGHQKRLHTEEYNITNTKITYIEDVDYNISSEIIYNNITNILYTKV